MTTESSTRPGWWRTGNVSARLVCLGAVLGAAGAAVHILLSAWGHEINAYALIWGLFFLVLEGFFMAILGLMVAGAVLSARFLVPDTANRKTRALVTGVVAFISSGVLAYVLFSILPMSDVPAVVGFSTGLLVGSVFAAVSYRHTSEA